ncbi:MAG: hypothetical protein ABJH98_05625 [Reichenbachiella sp.]|uniref:hypothetical protein n=1 Tax=Reichenbachiella sp. TaxID=2184521 RepID=UPI003298DB0F
MKKFTFSLGYILTLTFVVGITFQLFQWPFSNTIMLAGVTGLAVLFIPLWLLFQYEVHVAVKWIMVALSYALIFWFEYLKWPGAGELLLLGSLLFGFGILPYFFFRLYKKSLENM